MKLKSALFILTTLLLNLVACQFDKAEKTYEVTIEQSHSGSHHIGKGMLNKFVDQNLKGIVWNDFNKLIIEIKSDKKVLTVHRKEKGESHFTLELMNNEVGVELEINDMTMVKLQEIIDMWVL